ncbi:MAG: DegT/DnrJ/EryC1/StrS family aminotransferase [Treponemataceae bacterium]|nr:DegT/DnrJ/EryC1/StrS family aminotransferase [Treponemataceae bacterium]
MKEDSARSGAPMTVPFFRASLGEDEKKAVCDVIDSHWLTTGSVTQGFEDDFKAYIGAKHAFAVNSNTSGMLLAMDACGVRAGKAVITTPYTFVSTAACAVHLGADVRFADIEADSYAIDPEKIEAILKDDTEHKVCAIVPVHIAGNLCDMKKIRALAQKYSTPENRIYVIEDAAHSFPSKTAAGYAGELGSAGVVSFYVTKTMTTGEGGMVTTNDDAIARRIAVMRLHGMDRSAWDRYTSPRASWEYDIVACGYKCNLPDILSALGREQLKRAGDFFARRKAVVRTYNAAFGGCDFLRLPPDGEGNAWHLYLIRIVPEKLDCDRDTFARELQAAGIGISLHFIALFHFTYWKNRYHDFTARNFPHAAEHSAHTISLPLWPDMSGEMVDYVISTVTRIGEKHRKKD